MCGIAGFIGKGNEHDLLAMVQAIRHRGPDDQGIFLKEGVGLGHARLSIIDLSSAGHQPMWDESGEVAIIFNGEIYNFQALKNEFGSGYEFKSATDTEVILFLYKQFGENCFEKLDGMFAIAIYDSRKKELLLARDRIGEKPIYWSVQDGTFVFGSEIGALLAHPMVSRELNLEALATYLVREYVPTPLSIFNGISKLEPGHVLTYKAGVVVKKPFWRIPDEVSSISYEDADIKLDEILEQSIKDRMVADVPVGIFLSGGIDSSTLAYYAQKLSDQKVKTFSIGFDEASFDESVHARTVAEFLGTDHYHKKVSVGDALELVSGLASVLGEPLADPTIIPNLLLSKFTRGEVTVALGGDGGDELLAGYPTFQAEKIVPLYKLLPSFLKNGLIKPFVNSLPASDEYFSLAFKLQKFIEGVDFPPIERHERWLQSFSREEMNKLLTKEIYEKVARVNPYMEKDAQSPRNVLNSYLHSYLMDGVLAKVDRASMHYALEVRAPFLGQEVVEFLVNLPYEYKLRGLTTKYILKDLMKDKLPNGIVYRKKKGFSIPISEWLKKDLKPLLLEKLSRERISSQGIFDPDYVQKIIDEHLSGIRNNHKKLWTLLVFELWADEFLKQGISV